MTEQTTPRFNDGAAYERMMGKWSQLVGAQFIDWLAVPAQRRWIDVGCGNGAFTEMIVERCAPASVDGIDPSDAQLDFARTRPGASLAAFQKGVATELPHAAQSFDAAVMALVLFFVPEPAKGVAELVRVTRPGGTVAAYMWDYTRGGFPIEAVLDEMRALGVSPFVPPSIDASRLEAMRALWTGGGLVDVETQEIVVQRSFADFDDFWTTITGASVGPQLLALSEADRETLQQRVRARLPSDAAGLIRYSARANAIKGRVPG